MSLRLDQRWPDVPLFPHKSGTVPASPVRAMQVWISNTRGNVAYDHQLFAFVCDTLISVNGTDRVADRYQSMLALASLPWLDQPRFIEPTRLVFEIYNTWEDLWQVRVGDLAPKYQATGAIPASHERARLGAKDEQVVGSYLARPFHELAAFAASGGAGARLRVGTHRRLVVDLQRMGNWRVIRGGAAR